MKITFINEDGRLRQRGHEVSPKGLASEHERVVEVKVSGGGSVLFCLRQRHVKLGP